MKIRFCVASMDVTSLQNPFDWVQIVSNTQRKSGEKDDELTFVEIEADIDEVDVDSMDMVCRRPYGQSEQS